MALRLSYPPHTRTPRAVCYFWRVVFRKDQDSRTARAGRVFSCQINSPNAPCMGGVQSSNFPFSSVAPRTAEPPAVSVYCPSRPSWLEVLSGVVVVACVALFVWAHENTASRAGRWLAAATRAAGRAGWMPPGWPIRISIYYHVAV